MPLRKVQVSNRREKVEGIVVELEEEKEIVRKARDVAGDSHTLMTKYLGIKSSVKRSHTLYRRFSSGKNGNDSDFPIKKEYWEKMVELAKRYDNGERDAEVVQLITMPDCITCRNEIYLNHMLGIKETDFECGKCGEILIGSTADYLNSE